MSRVEPGERLVSTNDLARKLNVNKSTIHYYASLGLITPVVQFGRTYAFDMDDAVKTFRKITRLKKKGKTINDIMDILA